MHYPIEDTPLVVTDVLYQKAQTSLLGDKRGEVVTLLEIADSETGQKGHLYHEMVAGERGIEKENFWTDVPDLFSPTADASRTVRRSPRPTAARGCRRSSPRRRRGHWFWHVTNVVFFHLVLSYSGLMNVPSECTDEVNRIIRACHQRRLECCE